MLSHFRLSHETEVEHIIYILSSDWGVFFVFFLPSLSLPLCRRTVKYISTSAASPCMIFFFPFSSPESLSKFYCRDFSRAVVLHFPCSVLDGSGKQLRASVSQGRQKIKNDRLSSGCLSCASENVCSSDCILSCPRGWKWVQLLQYLRDRVQQYSQTGI